MKKLLSRLTRLIGGRFHLPAPDGGRSGEIVVMVHGLIRRGMNMYWLGRRINRAGYAVYLYDYPTTVKTIAEHGRDFKRFLEELAVANPGCRIHIVTHSMGGIITREALGHFADGGRHEEEILSYDRIGRIVMLAPPHYGSDVACRTVKYLRFSRRLVLPLAELSSAPDAYIHQVPVPRNLDIGIIAGRMDLEVKPASTRLPGMRDYVMIFSDHSFMMYLPRVASLSIKYLREGTFR